MLEHMRTGRQSLTKDYIHSYARRDYTREELEYDRTLRKKAGTMNSEEGKLVYVVRDLVIPNLNAPRDLPVRRNDQALTLTIPVSASLSPPSPSQR